MKKIALLAFATMLVLNAAAQDEKPPFNFFSSDFYIPNADSCYSDQSKIWYSHLLNNFHPDQYNKINLINQVLTTDTLTIYGLVHLHYHSYYDGYATLQQTVASKIQIYKPDTSGVLTLLQEQDYNILDTSSGVYYEIDNAYHTFITYFDRPATVIDSFYVGYEIYPYNYRPATSSITRDVWIGYPVGICDAATNTLFYYGDSNLTHIDRYHLVKHRTSEDSTWQLGFDNTAFARNGYSPYEYFCFPVLTPDPNRNYDDTIVAPDTTDVDTTHSAIVSAQLLQQYTILTPSATTAGTAVDVLSSFHLKAIEVYNAAGRLVSRTAASGLTAQLDTSHLPQGSYLVRLVTTAGATTKKLLIQ